MHNIYSSNIDTSNRSSINIIAGLKASCINATQGLLSLNPNNNFRYIESRHPSFLLSEKYMGTVLKNKEDVGLCGEKIKGNSR